MGESSKVWNVCPQCKSRNFLERKTIEPKYRCSRCGYEFDKPEVLQQKYDGISVSELEDKIDEIEDMYFNKGYGVSRIALKLNCVEPSAPSASNILKTKTGATEKIAMDILGYDNWKDYKEDHKRVGQKARIKAGFTQKLKRKVKQRDQEECVVCGNKKNLHVHHKDGDITNSSMDNLVTLCPNCHKRADGLRRGGNKFSIEMIKWAKRSRGRKRTRKGGEGIPSSPKREPSFSVCPKCSMKLASEKAVERHIENRH